MPAEPNEKIQIDGDVLSEAEFDALAEISDSDIQQALQDFENSVPDIFKGLLDASR